MATTSKEGSRRANKNGNFTRKKAKNRKNCLSQEEEIIIFFFLSIFLATSIELREHPKACSTKCRLKGIYCMAKLITLGMVKMNKMFFKKTMDYLQPSLLIYFF